MPRLRRNRYLTCFYCGRKTSTPYDGRIRRFDCPTCDATNYLDENGEIADPPVATDKEATPRQYAVPRPVSPPLRPAAEPIFCATCLKNQHLLSASLAQYLPDPEDPDYAEREKSFARFRRYQESLYPQICDKCEPKVRERLEQAVYTAKTDLLRRMLDRSASARKNLKTQGWLDLFQAVGKWLWIAGFVLQLAWHAVLVHALLSHYFVWAGMDDSLFTFRLLRICGPFVGWLPSPERLLRWSTLASILGVWWNPRFAQVYRGFSRHISGVGKWYFFQVVALVIRICLQKVDLTTPDPRLLSMQTAGHAFAAGFSLITFTLAARSIKVDTAPLFGSKPIQLREPSEPSTSSRPDDTKVMVELLDEISRSPTSPTPPSPVDLSPSIPRRSNQPPMGHTHTQAAQTISTSLQHLNSLSFADQPSPRSYYATEEMDWSPTPTSSSSSYFTSDASGLKSQYRAFNTQGQRQSQPFGSAPTEPREKPFWYRVPPAPTTPAQRVFNPPNQPRLRPSPVDKQQQQQQVRFRGDGTTLARDGNNNSLVGMGMGTGGASAEKKQVAFAEPSFFADVVVGSERAKSDPRNELSSMFGKGFKLEEGRSKEGGGWLKRFVGGGGGD
ncbi:hypothetical protein C8A03DRAFT_11593 [Achaetomium macrosporum]|uniref:Ima1 N-terminal domain-containing protein n=1 Tax=Achaetomium macrosporum TaxID=79813 RepID=A0AAN7CHM0_9PEZI|nr:hypothetical protein C8A03DRAFT_11593 [Achaetomium macrosporum]